MYRKQLKGNKCGRKARKTLPKGKGNTESEPILSFRQQNQQGRKSRIRHKIEDMESTRSVCENEKYLGIIEAQPTKTNLKKLQSFINKCLQKFFKYAGPTPSRTKSYTNKNENNTRKWNWPGHTLKKQLDDIHRHARK